MCQRIFFPSSFLSTVLMIHFRFLSYISFLLKPFMFNAICRDWCRWCRSEITIYCAIESEQQKKNSAFTRFEFRRSEDWRWSRSQCWIWIITFVFSLHVERNWLKVSSYIFNDVSKGQFSSLRRPNDFYVPNINDTSFSRSWIILIE